MITYYISGATGHLGRNIILQLLQKNDCRVVAFVLPNDKHRFFGDIGEEKITFVEGNLLDKEDVDKFLKTKKGDINYVIHCAGLITIYKKFEEKVYNVNVNGTKNMVDCATKNKVDKFIYISSVDAIPKPKKPLEVVEPVSFDENKVTGCYGITKAIASQYVLDANKKGLKALTIHPSALLGPNDLFGGPINLALTMFAKGKLNAIVTGGYDLVDVRDIASGIIKAIEKGTPGEAYILCGTQISIKGLINLSSEVTSLPSYKICLHSNFVKLFSPILELHAKIHRKKPLFTAYSMTCLHQNCNYSYAKAKKDFGYETRPLKETISDTFDWIYDQAWAKKRKKK